MLGILFLVDTSIQNKQNYLNMLLKIEKVLELWQTRGISLDSKTEIFKSRAISKIVMTPIPKIATDELQKIQKRFFIS